MGGVPSALARLGVDGLQRGLEEQVRHAAAAVVDEAHLPVQPVRLPERPVAVVLVGRLDREGDVDADLRG